MLWNTRISLLQEEKYIKIVKVVTKMNNNTNMKIERNLNGQNKNLIIVL